MERPPVMEGDPAETGSITAEARIRLTDALFDLLAARDRIDQLLVGR
jgi:hypothetical protein